MTHWQISKYVKPGDEIVTVNGRSIAEIRKLFDPYICASNPAAADRNFLWRFLFLVTTTR